MDTIPKFNQVLRCLPSIIAYLSQTDIVRLSSVNQLTRQYLLDNRCWTNLQFTDYLHRQSDWKNHCDWITKYLQRIQPTKLTISIGEKDGKEIIQTLMTKQLKSVESIEIYCENEEVHLAISLCFPEITQLIVKSRCVSDELMMFMGENLKKLTSLTVIKNDMNFTGKHLSKCLKQPMEKLQIKPYALDFKQICQVTQNSEQSLKELQLDVEECSKEQIVSILSPLKKLQTLRLFHLQNFQTDSQLYPIIKQQRLKQFCVTKAYTLPMNRIVKQLGSINLLHLNITDSKLVDDSDIVYMSERSPNLRHINISWCNNLRNNGVQKLFYNCLKLEYVYLTGLKQLDDNVFGQYVQFCKCFNQNFYNEAKHEISKHSKNEKEIYKLEDFFHQQIDASNIVILKNIKVLDCVSCNGISDVILKLIYTLRRKVKVINYYSNDLGLYAPDNLDDF